MRKILSSLLALLVTVTLFAAPRTVEEAAAIAARFTNSQPQLSRMHKAPRKAADMKLAHKALQNNSSEAAFYVFDQEDNNGFVIVSADDRTAEDVLGYTEKGSYSSAKVNRNFAWWLERYAEEITILQTIEDSQFVKAPARKAKQVTAIPNLLVNDQGKEITWYQEAPYSNLCPIDQIDQTRCLTGCVATAAAQVMYKYRYPVQGTGSKTYTWDDCIEFIYENGENTLECKNSTPVSLSANFGETTYDWNNMLPAYEGKSYTTAQASAVATLMYHVGVACEMMYGGDEAEGSGAFTDELAHGLINYFDYRIEKYISTSSKYETWDRWDMTPHADVPYTMSLNASDFATYFNADLEAGRPIVMGGTGNSGGHEFVCCGRNADGKFYINFGWEGSGNGYYSLTSLKPTVGGYTYNFSSSLDAIIGLEPNIDRPDVTVTWSVNGETSQTTAEKGKLVLPTDPEGCESGKVFVGWTAIEDYESETTAPTFVKAGTILENDATYYAVYATKESGSSSVEESITFSTKGYSNQEEVDGIEISIGDNSSVTFNQEDASNPARYYDGGAAIRVYGGGTCVVSSSASTISKIVFTFGTDDKDNTLTANTGSFDGTTWTGSASSVTFTVGGTTGHRRFAGIEVTVGGGVSYSDYSTSCGAPAEKYAITINPSTNGSLATSPSTEAAAGRKVTVTATPATHYQLATLTVKDADDATVTVSGEGNVRTFTMPAKAVTISGTFEEQAKVTVRFFDKGEQISSAQYFIGETAQKPANPIPSCDAYTFVGWWTAELPANNKEAKAWISNFTVTEAKDYYAIYSLTEDGQGSSTFDGTTGGNFKIYAQVSNDKYYATNEINDANKVESTTNAANAATFTLEKVSGGFTIKTGTNYLSYTGDGTNVELSTSAYTWDIQSNSGAWRVLASESRALALRVTNYYQSFGAYATSNASATGYYFNLGIEGAISSSTFYSSILNCGGSDIENTAEELKAIKIIRNGQLYILVGDQMYTITGARVQ